MNTQGAPLEFEMDLNTSDLKSKLASVEQQLGSMGQGVEKQGRMIDKAWAMGLAAVGGFAVGRFLGNTVRDIISVRGEFEKLEAVLTNTFGSESKAKSALAMIQDFASKTPFQVTDLTGSFVKLVNQGFKPTMEDMTLLGDLASSTGKGFDQLAEAILDAQTMQFERLKEFGIKAAKEGDKIVFTFKGQKTAVEANSESIQKYILSLGKVEGVQGSMAAISKTLVGQISNMKDSWDQLLNTLGTKSDGIFKTTIGWLTKLIGVLITATESIEQIRRDLDLKQIPIQTETWKKQIDKRSQQLTAGGMSKEEAQKQANEEARIKLQAYIEADKKEYQKAKEDYDAKGGTTGRKIIWNKEERDAYNKSYENMVRKQSALLINQGILDSISPKKVVTTPEDKDKILKDFKESLAKQKILYEEFEAVKTTTSLENAKRLFPKLEASYKDYLLKLRQQVKDNPVFSGVVATELMPIFKEQKLEQLPRILSFWEKGKVASSEELHITQKTKILYDEKLKSLIYQVTAAQDLRSEAEKEADKIKYVLNVATDLLGVFSQLTDESSQTAMGMNNLANALQSKSIGEGFIKFGIGVINDWIKSSKAIKELKIQADIDQITAAMDRLQYQLDNVDRMLDASKIDGYQKALVDLAQAGKVVEEQFNALSHNDKLNWFRNFGIDFDTTTIEQMQELIVQFTAIQNGDDKKENKINAERLKQLQDMLKLKQDELDIQNKIREAVTGTTSQAITDSIMQGFENGYDSIADFGNTFEEIMKKSILNSFKMKMIEPAMNRFFIEFAKAQESGGEITKQEQEDLKKKWDGWMAQFTAGSATIDQMFKDWGFTSGTTETSMAGAIKGITEDTANILAGQFNAMRITGVKQLDVAMSGLLSLQMIERNTSQISQTNNLLRSIDSKVVASNGLLISNRANGR
jgi:hypothetical protein